MIDDAIIPTRASKRSAGLDLYSTIDACIEAGSENSYGSIRDKSSLAANIRRSY